MNRLNLSIIVAIACAILLTVMRGGWRDAPLVVPLFAAIGFLFTYGIASIIGSQRLAALDLASPRRRGVPFLRDAAALALIGVSLVWSGRVIQDAGFGGWLVALFLGVVFPLIVCLLASHWLIVFGLLAATSLAASSLLHHPSFREHPFAREAWQRFWQHDVGVRIFIWGFLAFLSLIVSVPLTSRRRITTH